MTQQKGFAGQDEESRVVRKVYRHLIWFLVLLFIFSYLDRINIGFAALSMNRELGLTATMFGIANAAFYVVYVFAEVPSNMLLTRFGARFWLARIMVTWGIASTLTMLAVGPLSLYVLRAIVGLAEAGFMPGVLLYLTFWIPPAYRARAMAAFIMAQPITLMFGSAVSGMILDMEGILGLSGWRWLFLLEGLPSVILGFATYYYLRDSPAGATWLTDSEKGTLQRALERSEGEDRLASAAAAEHGGSSLWKELVSFPVLMLAIAYFGLVNSLSFNSTWVPQIVRALVPDGSFTQVGLVNAIPSLCTIAVMPFWCAHSDRTGERTWHMVLPILLSAWGWTLVVMVSDPITRMVGLVCCSVGNFSAQSVFWSMATSYLSRKARPIGVALVSSIGVSGSFVGPLVVGHLRDSSGSFAAPLLYVMICLVCGAACLLALSWRTRAALVQPTPATV
jgi:ACS family 4-hydroxyphenylacetate permease-like MFS transporter